MRHNSFQIFEELPFRQGKGLVPVAEMICVSASCAILLNKGNRPVVERLLCEVQDSFSLEICTLGPLG